MYILLHWGALFDRLTPLVASAARPLAAPRPAQAFSEMERKGRREVFVEAPGSRPGEWGPRGRQGGVPKLLPWARGAFGNPTLWTAGRAPGVMALCGVKACEAWRHGVSRRARELGGASSARGRRPVGTSNPEPRWHARARSSSGPRWVAESGPRSLRRARARARARAPWCAHAVTHYGIDCKKIRVSSRASVRLVPE